MILLNGSPINVTIFPDKTSQVWKLPEEILKETNYAHITWNFESEAEFMHLAQLKDLLDVHGFKSDLKLTYLPYGRQDKFIRNDRTFALITFTKFLNLLRFNKVKIIDPHSSVALDLIINSEAIYPEEELRKTAELLDVNILWYPDNGAKEKYSKIYPYVYMHSEKVRDQSNGNITKLELRKNPKKQKVLIVDDICDGGATFIALAKELYAYGAKEVNLFVSHGLFSKGTKVLKDAGIKRIFTKEGEIL